MGETPTAASFPSKSTYVLTGAALDGLPTRGLFKSDGKYFIKVIVDGEKEWSMREIKTKSAKVVWDEEEDRRQFDGNSASNLRVTLYKNHSSRAAEEVGKAVLSLTKWVEAANAVPLVLGSAAHGTPSIRVRLHLTETREAIVAPEVNDVAPADDPAVADDPAAADDPATVDASMQSAIAEADTKTTALQGLPGLSAVSTSTGKISEMTDGLGGIASAWEPLLDKLDAFTQMMDVVSEVHPYAKMAWTVLSAAYKVVRAQQDRDDKLLSLVEKMKDVYEFRAQALELQRIRQDPGKDKRREEALCRLASQTVECGHFIASYAKDAGFFRRLLNQTVSNVSHKIDDYNRRFDALVQDFQKGSQVRTEIMTVRILGEVKDLAADMDIRDIPYAEGAGYELRKRCLPGTRVDLLDEIRSWATLDNPDVPRVCFLMGPAGTGKSTIAHTIAFQFDTMKQLGSSFCFNASTRKPESLSRNVARNLATFHPAFKAALWESVGGDTFLCTTNDLDMQFDKFILEPAQALAMSGTIIIVIDALDESGTVRERAALLSLLVKRLHELPDAFRFLITCRPEQDILRLLHRSPMLQCATLQMPTPDQDTSLSSDILVYIRHTLSTELGNDSESLDDDCCVQLRDRAEGLFQWAFVACDYINGEPIIGQTARMRYRDLVTGSGGAYGLDNLYRTVLDNILSKNRRALESFRVVMGLILSAIQPLSRKVLRDLLSQLPSEGSHELESLTKDTILPLLGSLLSGVGEENVPIRPLHSSFGEMLRSPDRGGQYHINDSGFHETFARASLHIMKTRLRFNMGRLKTSYNLNRDEEFWGQLDENIPAALVYACIHWGTHLSKCPDGFEESVADLIHALFLENFLFWLEAASLIDGLGEVARCISISMSRLQRLGDEVYQMAGDGIRFIGQFARPLRASAAHLYVSALVWTPTMSKIAEVYRPKYPTTARVVSGMITMWPMAATIYGRDGHDLGISAAALSLDGTRIVSGSFDSTIRIWDINDGALVGEPLMGHDGAVMSVALSLDGALLASGSADKTIRLWDVQTGTCTMEPLTGHDDEVVSVVFSPDGKRIVSSSLDHTVRIWDVQSGKPTLGPLIGHAGPVWSLAVSPDGTRIASGSRDSMIRIWNLQTGATIGDPLQGHHKGTIRTVAFSPDGTRIVSGADDYTILIWDSQTGAVLGKPLKGHRSTIWCLAFSPDGKQLVSGSDDKTIRTWAVETGAVVGDPLKGHDDGVFFVAFLPDGARIVSGSMDNTIRIWDIQNGTASGEQQKGHDAPVMSVTFSPDGTQIASGSEDYTIRRWDAHTGLAVGKPLKGHVGAIYSVAFSPDGRQIISGSDDNTIRIWDAHTGAPVGDPLRDHYSTVWSVAFSPDGTRIVSGSGDHTIRIWNAETGESIGEPLVDDGDVFRAVAFSPDNKRIVSGSDRKGIRLWDVQAAAIIAEPLMGLNLGVASVAFSPDGTRIVSGSDDGKIRIWDGETCAAIGEPMEGHTSLIWCLSYSPNGTRVVSGREDKSVRIWDVETGTAVGEPLTGHEGPVRGVAFSPDGTRVASCAQDKTIRIWDARTIEGLDGGLDDEDEDGIAIPVRDDDGPGNTAGSEDNLSLREQTELDEQLEDHPVSEKKSVPEAQPSTQSTPPGEADDQSEDGIAHTFSLSPWEKHWLAQPYVSASTADSTIWIDQNAGWIMGDEANPIFWIPPQYIDRLATGRLDVIIPGPAIHVDLSNFVHGERWTECQMPLA
ncbi:WD40 repeat-like protein [Calocera cornea HHB12733]|uniref:WD40 repeat-like protein n=1 Tax=Calocera cornea HHB12733 TaxID=1353952 RepID=A0A165E5V9_9BASI|nr:WD40 repeat-like protein [Calocera cornea HHB12733]